MNITAPIMTLAAALLAAPAEGTMPARLLPPVIDGAGGEAWLTLHPSGELVVFGRHEADWGNHRLYVSRRVDGVWSAPEPAPFNMGLDGRAAHFTPSGNGLLFVSSRPMPGAASERHDTNIWRVGWDGAAWGQPTPLPEPINSEYNEVDAVETRSGTIYFSSTRPSGGGGPVDLYSATAMESGLEISSLADVNTGMVESTLAVSADECLIVFNRTDDPQGPGRDDLFFAFRMRAGWSAPAPLPAGVNSPTYEYGPEFSSDRRTLFYTTHRDGRATVAEISTAGIVAALYDERAEPRCRL